MSHPMMSFNPNSSSKGPSYKSNTDFLHWLETTQHVIKVHPSDLYHFILGQATCYLLPGSFQSAKYSSTWCILPHPQKKLRLGIYKGQFPTSFLDSFAFLIYLFKSLISDLLSCSNDVKMGFLPGDWNYLDHHIHKPNWFWYGSLCLVY